MKQSLYIVRKNSFLTIPFLLLSLLVEINSFGQCNNNFPLKVQGDSIILNDGTERRFFVSGMVDNNKPRGMQLSDYDPVEMEEELQSYALAGCNAMRWNAFLKGIDITWDASSNVSGVKPGCLANLRDGLDRAYNNKIMVQIVLSTAHFQQYGFGGIDNVLGGIRNGDRVDNFYKMFTTDEGTQAYIDNIIQPMIDEIGNHPALIGYVIINEAYGMTDPRDTPFGVWADRTPRLVDFQKYVNKVVSAIHTLQPGALCTVSGVAGARQMYGDAELLAAGGDPNGLLDHFQYQYYPIHHVATFSPFQNSLKDMESIWGGDSKPVIAGEFPIEGIATTEYNSIGMTPTEAYEALWGNGYSGGFTWENNIYKSANSTLKSSIDQGYTTFKNNHLLTLDPWEYWDSSIPCKDCNGDDYGFADYDDCGVCSGGNTGITPNSLCEVQTYSLEAEEGNLVGVTEQNSISGYSGTGYVGNFKSTGDQVTVTVDVENAITHEVWVYYHTPSGNKKLDLLVNGIEVGEVSLNQNAAFEGIQVAKVFLEAGINTITIRRNMGFTYIDKFELISDPVQSAPILANNISVQGENGVSTILLNGGILQMEAEVLPADATNKNVNWSVIDGTGSASIDANGLLTPSTSGTVTVKATAVDGSEIEGTTTIQIGTEDCNGDWNGTASIDACGVCSGGSTGIEVNTSCEQDCNGEFGGTASVDDCGVCSGGSTGIVANTSCEQDCNGEFGGTASVDDCGVCSGGSTGIIMNSSCQQDCNGEFGGTASVDDCGVCSGGSTGIIMNSSCQQDCNGEFGGTASVDDCGVCSGGSTGIEANTSCEQDCNGEFGGTAFVDDCGVCSGGSTGIIANTSCEQDCNGEFGGTASVDDCGVCSGGSTGIIANTSCEQDCNGDFGGSASVDDCGVCSGGSTGIDIDDCVTTAINDMNNESKVHIYPNPSHSQISIKGEFDSWILTDSKGVFIKEGTNGSIDVESLSSGFYLLKIDDEIKKFIKD